MKRAAASLASALLIAFGLSAACGPGHSSSISPWKDVQRDLLTHPLTVEVFPVSGHAPTAPALDLLAQRAQENASGIASIVTHGEIIDPRPFWTQGQLSILVRDHEPIKDPYKISVVYAPGLLVENFSAAGCSVTPTCCAIFTDAPFDKSLEGAALVHEFGHLWGLVSNPAHSNGSLHDLDPKCVMFFRLDGSEDFCTFCKADLVALKR